MGYYICSALVLLAIGSNAAFAGENKDALSDSASIPGTVERTYPFKDMAIGAYETYWFGQNFHPKRIAKSEKSFADLKKFVEDGKPKITVLSNGSAELTFRDPKFQKPIEKMIAFRERSKPVFKLINATMAIDGIARFASGITSDREVGWFALDDLAGVISEKVSASVDEKVNQKQEATRGLADESATDAAVR